MDLYQGKASIQQGRPFLFSILHTDSKQVFSMCVFTLETDKIKGTIKYTDKSQYAY